jgi:hypothetical protein
MIDRFVLVVGTGRSGTSFVAKCLEEIGVDMGGPGTVRDETPDGDYEDIELRAEEDSLLAEFAAARKLGSDSDAETVVGFAVRDFRDGVVGILDPRARPVGYKTTRGHQTLGYWLELFPAARIVWAHRDPEDTARSFARSYGRDFESSLHTVHHRLRELPKRLAGRDFLAIACTARRDPEEVRDLLARWLSDWLRS